ncbi:MAG: ATP-binding cassette domain-containing protein [Oligoflexia bacterium]|nr:ATP-binding cassette domain-containing protein [Oligoflexia bacterium]
MIEMENITKNFYAGGKEFSVLKGISLFIGKGEFVSIMGPSGSGKSTLSSILGCLAKPSFGKYSILGSDIVKMRSNDLAKLRNRNIGFIFQDFSLLDSLSVLENVQLPLFYAGVSGRKSTARAMECLESVELKHRAHYRPSQLSGGQKQRVAIARALVNRPSFLFADEPTGALDQKTGQGIMNLMQKLNFEGQTIVQVTHSSLHCKYSKRILSLVDGLIVRDEMVQDPIIVSDLSNKTQRDHDDLINSILAVFQKTKNREAKNFDFLKNYYNTCSDHKNIIKELSKTLCYWSNEDSKRMIFDLFENQDVAVRSEIVLNCGNLKFFEFELDIYKRALKDENNWIRYYAVNKIVKMYYDKILKMDDKLEKSLIRLFADQDERVRATAVSLFYKYNSPLIIKHLLQIVRDSDSRVRANAIQALAVYLCDGKNNGRVQENTAIKMNIIREHILKFLDDSNNRVRANAALAVSPFFFDRSIGTLTEMLFDGNNLMRVSAAWALRFLEDESTVKLLVKALKSETEEMVINQITSSLAHYADKGKVSTLEQQIHALG